MGAGASLKVVVGSTSNIPRTVSSGATTPPASRDLGVDAVKEVAKAAIAAAADLPPRRTQKQWSTTISKASAVTAAGKGAFCAYSRVPSRGGSNQDDGEEVVVVTDLNLDEHLKVRGDLGEGGELVPKVLDEKGGEGMPLPSPCGSATPETE